MRTFALLFLLLLSAPAFAQNADAPPIQDNSFLIEEAYNQEMGVVQHITTWEQDYDSHDWVATFTQEWPFLSPKHQLSYTLSWNQATPSGAGGDGGPGDLALNYRYQLVGDGNAPLAISPRLTLLLPTGDEKKGRGAGAAGLQANLPVSWAVSSHLTAHTNVGFTWTPNAKDESGEAEADNFSPLFGQSLVWSVHPRVNLMLEAVYSIDEVTVAPGLTAETHGFTISPGVRWSYNLPSGLQIVPGIAFPIGVGPSDGEKAVFLYLSFEHPF